MLSDETNRQCSLFSLFDNVDNPRSAEEYLLKMRTTKLENLRLAGHSDHFSDSRFVRLFLKFYI